MENLLIELENLGEKAYTIFSEDDANMTPFVLNGMEDAITKYFTQIASTLQHRHASEMADYKALDDFGDTVLGYRCLGFADGLAYALEVLGLNPINK